MADEEEFRINEPRVKKSKQEIYEEKVKRANRVEFALKCSLILEKKDLDADNIFNVKKDDFNFCTLTNVLPCKNPHCLTCNLPLMRNNLANKIMDFVGDETMKMTVIEIKSELNDEMKKMFEQLKKKIERDLNGKDE